MLRGKGLSCWCMGLPACYRQLLTLFGDLKKSGVNGLLDVARQVYKEVTEDVHQLVEGMSREYDLPLELKYEAGRGYYLRLPASEIEDKPLPAVFVNVVKRKKVVEFSALEMLKCNAKVNTIPTEKNNHTFCKVSRRNWVRNASRCACVLYLVDWV